MLKDIAKQLLLDESPSSRRAWIEMRNSDSPAVPTPVALLAEGVDRNIGIVLLCGLGVESPSSRRAWIEIWQEKHSAGALSRRPPRGGRG